MEQRAFQDLIPDNHCYGCGPKNEQGLRIKSHWSGKDQSICRFMPSPHHCAGPWDYLNGGIIATLMDCHCVCTAIAKGYDMAGRTIGEGERIWYVTGGLDVSYRQPVTMQSEVVLNARIETVEPKKITLSCQLLSDNTLCAQGKVVAVRVPLKWQE